MADLPRHLQQTNQRYTTAIANRVQSLADRRTFEVLYYILASPTTGAPLAEGKSGYLTSTGVKVSVNSGDRSVGVIFDISAGVGFKYLGSTQTDDDEPRFMPVHVPTAFQQTADPSDGTNPRIDRLFLKPKLTPANPQNVDVIDPATKNITQQALNQDNRYEYDVAYVAGTPAASPSVPAAPSGFSDDDEIARWTMDAGAGAFDPNDLTDQREILGLTALQNQGTFTTGDGKLTLKSSEAGWVLMDDGTIGNAGSGATSRANDDTEALYVVLWNAVSDSWAPVSGGRGASALADFNAGKPIALTKQLGRALAIAGAGSGLTSRALGEWLGEEGHVQTGGELKDHVHQLQLSNTSAAGSGADEPALNSQGVSSPTGTPSAMNVMQPSSFWNVLIKL